MNEATIVSSICDRIGEVYADRLDAVTAGHGMSNPSSQEKIGDSQATFAVKENVRRHAAIDVSRKASPCATLPTVRINPASREDQWATWLRAAVAGDALAYRNFLESVAPFVRALARKRCARIETSMFDPEDIVQDVLLAIHLKRGTWDPSRPIGPWVSAIVRNKVIDSFRRHGRRLTVPIESVIDTLEAKETARSPEPFGLERVLGRLKEAQRKIVTSVSVEGASVRQTAQRLGMSEGAVRVAFHRALKSLAAFYRDDLVNNA